MQRFVVVLAACVSTATAASGADAPVRLPRPAFPPPVTSPAAGGRTMEIVSSQPLAGDELAWVRRNRLDLREYHVPGALSRKFQRVPGFVQPTYRNHRLVRAIRQRNTLLLVYGPDFSSGRYLVAVSTKGRVRYALDLVAFGRAPVGSLRYQEVVWAAESGGMLYVETAHPTYARDSGYRNAYVSAIDLAKKRLRWRSPALVANALTFELYGNLIVTGYGFTAEADYLYALDRRTGKAVSRTALPTAAEFIVRKRDLLFVRTYDHDLVVRLS